MATGATGTMTTRPPLPPFTRESAVQKVRLAENGWNSRDPEKVALAYAIDSRWRNRSEFINGRNEIIAFLSRKWAKELDYRLVKELWAFTGNRIAVRFAYEWHDDSGHSYRSYGNENWASCAKRLPKCYLTVHEIPNPSFSAHLRPRYGYACGAGEITGVDSGPETTRRHDGAVPPCSLERGYVAAVAR